MGEIACSRNRRTPQRGCENFVVELIASRAPVRAANEEEGIILVLCRRMYDWSISDIPDDGCAEHRHLVAETLSHQLAQK